MHEQWMKVSRGFKLVYVGLVLFVVAFIGGVIAVFAAAAVFAKGAREPGILANLIAVGMLLCILAGSITGLVGRFFCLSIPSKAGSAKTMIMASVALEVAGMGFGTLNQIRNLANLNFGPTLTEVLQMGWVFLSMGSAVLFLLFTKAAAQFIDEEDLAEKASSVLWLWAATFGCYVIVTVITLAVIDSGGGGAAAFGGMCFVVILLIVAFVLAIKALIRFVALTREMSDAIDGYARRTRRAKRQKRERERKLRKAEEEEEEEDEEEEDERPWSRRQRPRKDDDKW